MDQWQDFLGHPEGAKLGAISAALYIPSIVYGTLGRVRALS
jgi:hypothetical protein